MITVSKGDCTINVRDNNQLAAYLNNGWSLAQEKPAKATPAPKKSEPVEEAEPAEEKQEEAPETAEETPVVKATTVKRGRKSTKTE